MPKKAEDYLLDTAEQFRTPTESGSYEKDYESFDLHEEFSATAGFQTEFTITDKVKTAEVLVDITFEESITDNEREQTIKGLKRELTHMVTRSFPGHVELISETHSNDGNYKMTYQIST